MFIRKHIRYFYIFLAFLLLFILSVISFFYIYDLFTGIYTPYNTGSLLLGKYPESDKFNAGSWEMHPVDNPGDWLANGLSIADINGDGFSDFLTNYEFSGRIRVAINPGPGEIKDAYLNNYWEGFNVAVIPNAESSAFADIDNDGFFDIIVAHGIEHTTKKSGIKIIWGGSFEYSVPVSIPSAPEGMHFHYIKAYDIDSDGDADIVAGGRATRIAGTQGSGPLIYAGLRWFENPGKVCREVSLWRMHVIDEDIESGHGFEFGDIDGDGISDIALCNSDWDTPQSSEKVVWYKNPGIGQDIYKEWQINEIYRGSEFYTKEQLAIYDINSDSLNDITVHTEKYIYIFLQSGNIGNNLEFTLQKIEKPSIAQWPSRAIEIADINNDGSPDIAGALIHKNGKLPKDKAAVFWMENIKGQWLTHVIKWGDGFLGLGRFNGEKWDQMIFLDMDKDGDTDIVANCEEYNRLRSVISVVWFENPLIKG
jgi:hypothetical protein